MDMKQDIFDEYVAKVIDLFGISKRTLFSKTKKREVVDARYLLYALCQRRNIQVSYIQKYMKENGYKINHSSIIHGLNVVTDRMLDDDDYIRVINRLENKTN